MTKKSVKEITEVFKKDHETILAYMEKGLQATYLGLKVYNTDIPNDRNADEDPLAPSMEKRREARRTFFINQMRKERGQPYTQDISEDPDGTHGISFTLPQNIKNRKKINEKINEFRIDDNEFLRYHPSPNYSNSVPLANHQKNAKSEIIEYAERRSKAGNPLVNADFTDDSDVEIARICKHYSIIRDTLRKYTSDAMLLSPSKTGPKHTHQ